MMNPVALVKMMRNPQMAMQTIMQQNPQLQNNQPLMNAFNAIQNGDMKQAEQIARNVCQQNGVNPDEMISNLKNNIGMQ